MLGPAIVITKISLVMKAEKVVIQEIIEPTHILNNSSSCIDLIFNCQPNLLIESGVHPPLDPVSSSNSFCKI